MASYAPNSSGAFSTASVWDRGTNSPSIHATTNITVSAGGIFSVAFTAPSITDDATGVIFYVGQVGTAGTLTATLQEFDGVSWNDVGASAAVLITSLEDDTFHHFRLSAPYTFTTVTAGYYRWKLNTAGATGTTAVAANSVGSNFAYLSMDDRNAVPGVGDDVLVIGLNAATALTLTVDATQSFGSSTDTGLPVSRSWGSGIYIGGNGIWLADTVANSDITCQGGILVDDGGAWRMGTTTTPIPDGIIAKMTIDQNSSSARHGIEVIAGGEFTCQGRTITSTSLWKGSYASGVGTAADPLLITESVDWDVDDEIHIGATADYDETEVRYIITKNSATSYVVSSTQGGAETALVNTHAATARIVNATRNVIITTGDSTLQSFFHHNHTASTGGDIDIDWSRFEYFGGTTTISLQGFQATSIFASISEIDYSVLYNPTGYAFHNRISREEVTYTGIYVYRNRRNVAVGDAGFIISTANQKLFIDCISMDAEMSGFIMSSSFGVTFTDCEVWGCNSFSNANQGGWRFVNSQATLSDCVGEACEDNHLVAQGSFNSKALDCSFGQLGTVATIDVRCVDSTFNNLLLQNCLVSATTSVDNYTEQIAGSEIKFHKFDQTENDHRWFTSYGSARSTGAALADTTVRTTDSLALRISPEDSINGFEWSFKIPADSSSAVAIYGFIKKNVAFGTDVASVELYLPGSTTPDDSYNMPNNTNWNVFNLAASYTGTVDAYATVLIRAQSTTSGAYIYVDDLYNGTNILIGLDLWDEGQPSSIMFEQYGDPDAVWSIRTDTTPFTTSGTAGNRLVKLLRRSEFIALD